MRPTALPGAVAASAGPGVAWHYGDPLREQRLLRPAAGVDRPQQPRRTGGVRAGPAALAALDLLAAPVSNLADGESTEALVLSPNGHVEQHWQLTERDGTVWLDTEPGTADEALAYLQKMRFLKRVEPGDVSDEWAVVGLVGPAADAVLLAAGHSPPVTGATAAPGGGFARRTPVGRRRPRRPEGTAGRRNRRPGRRRCGARRTVGLRGASGSRLAGRGCGSRPTTGRSRTRWAGSTRRYISTRAAIGARRRWRACRIWAGPRVGSCSCILAGESDVLPEAGTSVEHGRPVSWFSGDGRAAPRAWARWPWP